MDDSGALIGGQVKPEVHYNVVLVTWESERHYPRQECAHGGSPDLHVSVASRKATGFLLENRSDYVVLAQDIIDAGCVNEAYQSVLSIPCRVITDMKVLWEAPKRVALNNYQWSD